MAMQRRIPTVVMRGGTSKALFFHANHLPADETIRDRLILRLYGSPDPKQIDGLGGATSVTSKTAIISVSSDPRYDVEYNFGQVSLDRCLIDYKGNCGNISSAVGPFAVDEGLVPVTEPVTTVRIHQKNTDKLIVAEVPVTDGLFDGDGDYAISGVPGTASRITLHFHDPAGSITGKLLPTGSPRDLLSVPGLGEVEISVVDAANPVVFVSAKRLGLRGGEIRELSPEARAAIEAVRARTAVLLGFAATPEEATLRCQAVPKIAFVSPPMDYATLSGETVTRDRIDLTARIMTMGTLHKSFAVTGAICTAGAAMIEGTVVNEAAEAPAADRPVRIGHPGGVIEIGADIVERDGAPQYRKASVGRTSRRLMEGYALAPESLWSK
jgi:2-methylaconitate cis-trans-isomerase PrpF